jgi:small-conductance mechanosensitive channel
MSEEGSVGKAALKAVEREEKVAKHEQAAAKAGQQESGRKEQGSIRSELSKAAPQADLTAVGSYDYLAELNRAGMNAALQVGEAMLKATSSLAEELTSFAAQRLRTDAETGRSLVESGNDWNKAVELQGQFAAETMRDYLEEMTKIAQLSVQTTRDVWTPLQEFSTRLARGDAARPS